MLFVLVPFLKRAPHIIIHLAMNVEKGGGVLMRITLPNLKHSFICPVPVAVPVPDFPVFHTPFHKQISVFRYVSASRSRDVYLTFVLKIDPRRKNDISGYI